MRESRKRRVAAVYGQGWMGRLPVWGVGLAVLAAWLAPAGIGADEIELTSGRKYQGKVLEKTDSHVLFRAMMGGGTAEFTFPARQVRNVTYGPLPDPLAPSEPPASEGPKVEVKLRKKGEPHGLTWTKANTASREEVLDLIQMVGKRTPDWWDSAAVSIPPTLDLTWAAPADPRDSSRGLAAYLERLAYPSRARWREAVKVLDNALTVNRNDPERLSRTHLELGKAHQHLLGDWARAAYWYGQVAGDDVEKLLGLAECYWKLGNKDLAAETLARFIGEPTETGRALTLWSKMGETAIALDIAEQMAQAGQPDAAYLAAGNACRRAGDWQRALDFYATAAGASTGGRYRQKNRIRAQLNIQAVKVFQGLDFGKIDDGEYVGRSGGYLGAVEVKVPVKGGRIESVEVVRQREVACLTAPDQVPAQIVARQGPEGVDTVTCATITSEAIINAAANALAAGQRQTAAKPRVHDGTYRGSAFGYKSNIVVEVTIKDGKITDCKVVSQKETRRYYDRTTHIPAQIVQRQGVGGVDTVTRATRSSAAILKAAAQAIEQAKQARP